MSKPKAYFVDFGSWLYPGENSTVKQALVDLEDKISDVRFHEPIERVLFVDFNEHCDVRANEKNSIFDNLDIQYGENDAELWFDFKLLRPKIDYHSLHSTLVSYSPFFTESRRVEHLVAEFEEAGYNCWHIE